MLIAHSGIVWNILFIQTARTGSCQWIMDTKKKIKNYEKNVEIVWRHMAAVKRYLQIYIWANVFFFCFKFLRWIFEQTHCFLYSLEVLFIKFDIVRSIKKKVFLVFRFVSKFIFELNEFCIFRTIPSDFILHISIGLQSISTMWTVCVWLFINFQWYSLMAGV